MKYPKKNGFLALLQRYMGNTTTRQEKEAMDIWYDALGDPAENEPNAQQKSQLEHRLWSKVEKSTIGKAPTINRPPKYLWNNSFFRIATAASVILVLGFMYFFTNLADVNTSSINRLSKEEISTLQQATNTEDKPLTIALADGSNIILEKGSTLYYPKQFTEAHRTVYLDGDGFFDIAKNPEKPFLVYSGDIVTKVLGTSFTIHQDKSSGKMEVAVITGKVIVEKSEKSSKFFESKNSGVVLTPNEMLTFLPDKQEYITGLVEKPLLIENSETFVAPNAFVFDDTPLSAILNKLEQAYGVDIQTQNKSILNCTVTADLGSESLFTQLDILNALLNSESVVQGKVIMISGGECKPFAPKNKLPM